MGWSRLQPRQTDFPLTGAHVAGVLNCHSSGVYNGLSTVCSSCHQADYHGTTNPNHSAAGFPVTCQTCHTTTEWTGAVFDHSQTDFPLTGAHVVQECLRCHSGGIYDGLSTLCSTCHQADYQGTTNPNHQQAGFSTTCQQCHNTNDWAGAVYNHAQTSFPLTGAHTTAPCSACHSGGVYNGLSTVCSSCHQADYQGTTNPNHVQAGFPSDCSLVPWHDRVESVDVQPHHEQLPADRRAPAGDLRLLPLRRRLQRTEHSLLLLPPGGLPGDDQSEPPAGRVLDHLPAVPQHDAVGRGGLQPCPDELPADRSPHDGTLLCLPLRWGLQRPQHRLLLVPPGGLPGSHEPEPRPGRVPDRLHLVPWNHRVESVVVQPHYERASR